MKKIDEKMAKEQLELGYVKAERILKDDEKFEKFLQKLEKKLKIIPAVGDKLAIVPIMISLIKNYKNKEYTEIPLGSIIAIVSALLYLVSPVDIIPDVIPGAGLSDDVGIIAVCLKLVQSDIDEYQLWREKNNKMLEV